MFCSNQVARLFFEIRIFSFFSSRALYPPFNSTTIFSLRISASNWARISSSWFLIFSIQLGNGEQGTDVRVRNNRLHCQNCYSNDEGKLLLSLFVPTFTFTFPTIIVTFIFRVEVQQSVIATEERKIYTRLALSWTAWVASWTAWATLWSHQCNTRM